MLRGGAPFDTAPLFRGGAASAGSGPGVIAGLLDHGGYVDPNLLPLNSDPNSFDIAKASTWYDEVLPVQPWGQTNILEFHLRSDETPGSFIDWYNSKVILEVQFNNGAAQLANKQFQDKRGENIQCIHPLCGGLMLFKDVEVEISGTIITDETNTYYPFTAFVKTCMMRTQQKLPDLWSMKVSSAGSTGDDGAIGGNVEEMYPVNTVYPQRLYAQEIVASFPANALDPTEYRAYLMTLWSANDASRCQLKPFLLNPFLAQRKYVSALFPTKLRLYKLPAPPLDPFDFYWAVTDRSDGGGVNIGLELQVVKASLYLRRITLSAAGQQVWLEALNAAGVLSYPVTVARTSRFPISIGTTDIREKITNSRKPTILFVHIVPSDCTDYTSATRDRSRNPFTLQGLGSGNLPFARQSYCKVGAKRFPKQNYMTTGGPSYGNPSGTRKGGTSMMDWETYARATLPYSGGRTDGWQPFLSYDAFTSDRLFLQVYNLTENDADFFGTKQALEQMGDIELHIQLENPTVVAFTMFCTGLYHEVVYLDPKNLTCSLSY